MPGLLVPENLAHRLGGGVLEAFEDLVSGLYVPVGDFLQCGVGAIG